MEEKQQLLDQVKLDMESKAGVLPLTHSPKDIVPAEGNSEAEIMFIGEAAGYHELIERRPFVGVAGKLLTATLADNDMKREEVWISNVVKTRPPNNRDPLPEEILAFKPFLDREIEIIQPKIIVTLGRFSMYKFLGDQVRISQVHGQARWVNLKLHDGSCRPTAPSDRPRLRCSDRAGCGGSMGRPAGRHPSEFAFKVVVLPMYHPAAALRSSAVKKMFEDDFKKLPKILWKINGENDKIEEDEKPSVANLPAGEAGAMEGKEEQLKLI